VKSQAANSSAAPASADQVRLVVIRSLVPQVPQRDPQKMPRLRRTRKNC